MSSNLRWAGFAAVLLILLLFLATGWVTTGMAGDRCPEPLSETPSPVPPWPLSVTVTPSQVELGGAWTLVVSGLIPCDFARMSLIKPNGQSAYFGQAWPGIHLNMPTAGSVPGVYTVTVEASRARGQAMFEILPSTCDRSLSVTDVTAPPETVVLPGQTFTKTWRVRVEHPCAQPSGWVQHSVGDWVGGPDLTLPLGPERDEYDITMPLKAPTVPGAYVSYWSLYQGNTTQGLTVSIRVLDPAGGPLLTNEDNGRAVEVTVGQRIWIALHVIPEGADAWHVDPTVDRRVVRPAGRPAGRASYSTIATYSGAPGSGIVRIPFEAAAVGETRLSLAYREPSKPADALPPATYAVTVTVRPK